MNISAKNLSQAYKIVKEYEDFVEGIEHSLGLNSNATFQHSFQDGMYISFVWEEYWYGNSEMVFRRFPLQMLADCYDMDTPEVLVQYYEDSTRKKREEEKRRQKVIAEAKAEAEKNIRRRQFLELKKEFGDEES